jgi:nitric oxide reductase NorE protein
MLSRNGDIDLYRASQQTLSRNLGGFNTLVLILGSWAVMRALDCVRCDRAQGAARWLAGAAGCGVTFFCVKIVEYGDKLSHGLFPTTNDFFTFYFVLTMIHLVHLIIGTIVLLVMRRGVIEGAYRAGHMAVLDRGDLLASGRSFVDVPLRSSLSFAVMTMTGTGTSRRNSTLPVLLAAPRSFLLSHDGALGVLGGRYTGSAGCGRLVLLDFMELRDAPRRWRLGFEGGLLGVTALLTLIYHRR